jgi:hypothetical protein
MAKRTSAVTIQKGQVFSLSTEEAVAKAPQEELTPVYVFRDMVSQIEGVEAVIAASSPEGLSIWAVVNESNRELRSEIYALEWDLGQRFSHTGFDFHVLDRHGRSLADLLSVEGMDIYIRIPGR